MTQVSIINASPPSAVYRHQWIGSALLQVMACRLFGAKPLPEPMLDYCHLDSWEQISVKFESEFYCFHSRKCIWNCRLPKWRPFYQGGMNYCLEEDMDPSIPLSVPWLLMAWLISSPVHHQPCHWYGFPVIYRFQFLYASNRENLPFRWITSPLTKQRLWCRFMWFINHWVPFLYTCGTRTWPSLHLQMPYYLRW